MASIMSLIPGPQSWPVAVLVLLLTVVAVVLAQVVASRPSFPSSAPRLLKGWPVLGSIDFFRDRAGFLDRNAREAPGGQFSFYYGPHPIVAVSGPEARASFFNTRGLDLNKGFATLFAAAPNIDHLHAGDMTSQFVTMFKRLLQRDRLADNLHHMTTDANAALANMDTSAPIDPFAVMLRLVYQLTHRTLGSNDIANDPKLLADTLAVFGRLDDSSAVEIMFPKLPWPSKLRKMWAGARLHWAFSKIVRERRKTGRTDTDAMQTLMEAGHPDLFISVFIMGSLFAGLINSTFSAAWILSHLTDKPEWYARIQAEVDGVLAKYRQSPDEPIADVIARLPMEAWESEFPLVDVALRETIRLDNQGVSIRKNISGKDVQIGNTGQVIPSNAFAVYGMGDIHMNEHVYPDPGNWDPERYLPGREEDKKQPHAYVGWGTGLHPCLGMRFAKLEIAVSTVTFFAHYDFKRCDKHGNEPKDHLPIVDRSGIGEKRPVRDIFLQCTRRT